MLGTRKDDLQTLAARCALTNTHKEKIRLWNAMLRRFGPSSTDRAIAQAQDALKTLGG